MIAMPRFDVNAINMLGCCDIAPSWSQTPRWTPMPTGIAAIASKMLV